MGESKGNYSWWEYAPFKEIRQFLPGNWPSYFSKAKGCKVWDLDGNQYLDLSIMGIGTNILGYGNQKVDEAVSKHNNKWKYELT